MKKVESEKMDKPLEISWTEHSFQDESSGCSVVPVTF